MPNLNISASIDPADKATLISNASHIMDILKFMVNLDPKTRKRLRKMATKRTGYVKDVYMAVLANSPAIPDTFDIDGYKSDMTLYDDLHELLGYFLPIVEGIQDTMLALGNDLMKQSDTCYNYLQRAAKDNAPLTDTVARIGTAYRRSTPKAATAFTIAAAGATVIEHVKPGTRIVNTGTSVIKFKPGNDLASKVRIAYITIDPGNSEVIPKGYTSIVVENVSTTAEAIFTVRMK